MKDLIKIGIPSKGRLRKDVLNIFKKNKLKLISSRGGVRICFIECPRLCRGDQT